MEHQIRGSWSSLGSTSPDGDEWLTVMRQSLHVPGWLYIPGHQECLYPILCPCAGDERRLRRAGVQEWIFGGCLIEGQRPRQPSLCVTSTSSSVTLRHHGQELDSLKLCPFTFVNHNLSANSILMSWLFEFRMRTNSLDFFHIILHSVSIYNSKVLWLLTVHIAH